MVWWTGFFRAVDPCWMCVLALLWRWISCSVVYFFFWVRSNQKCWAFLSSAEPIALNNGLNMWRAADERLIQLQSEWMFWKPKLIIKSEWSGKILPPKISIFLDIQYMYYWVHIWVTLVLWNSGCSFRFRIMSVALVFQVSLELFVVFHAAERATVTHHHPQSCLLFRFFFLVCWSLGW